MPSYVDKKSPLKLDTCDKKILYYLGSNFHMSRKQLSTLTKTSPQKIHYKINRLRDDLIHPTIIFDYPRLDISSYIIFVKGQLDKELVSTFLSHTSLYFFYQIVGRYSALINLVGEDPVAFCKKYLPNNEVEISPIQEYIPGLNFNPFNLKLEKIDHDFQEIPCALDKKDYQLLYCMCENPTHNVAQISYVTGLDRKTIIKRIDKLQKAKIIRKFRFSFDIFRYGIIVYVLKIKASAAAIDKIFRLLENSNYDGFTYRSYNLLVHQHPVPNHEALLSFVNEVRKLNAKVEVLQKTDKYNLHCIPKKVIEILRSRI